MIKRHIEQKIESDLTVVGGGIAGCCVAIAASRLGLCVSLVHNRSVLGGNGSSEVGLLIGSADRDFPHAREGGLVEEINLLNRYHNHEIQWRNCISDFTLETIVKDANVNIFFNTHVDNINYNKSSIVCVSGSQQSSERQLTFQSPLFVDASGDGTIAALSGASWMMGTEGKKDYNEKHAPEEPSTVTMGSTIMFRIKNVDRPVSFIPPHWAYRYPSAEDLPVKIRWSLEYPQLWIEYGALKDTISDNYTIRDELLKILFGVWDHIKNYGSYNAENYVLSWVGSIPGKRESRRIIGDYVLKEQDLVESKKFYDAVAYGGWPIDVHNPEGFFAKEKWTDYLHLKEPYQIPYRCYYSKDIKNLFIAGRIISATHIAHGSTRLQGTCGAGGQAVGTAAYLCNKYDCLPRELLEKGYVPELQQILLKHDAFIPGITNNDPNDLAQQAQVKASSEYTDKSTGYCYKALRVLEGVSRGRSGDENLWMSNPISRFYQASLELNWEKPIVFNTVHLTFDTKIREQRFFDRFELGPMPTCARDYSIFFRDDIGEWQVIESIYGNFLRHNIIKFDAIKTNSLMVKINRTNGDSLARIYEVRVYNESEE